MAKNLNLKNWMGALDGARSLSALTIPGTHDSCTASFKGIEKIYVRTQDHSVLAQLNAGIRFLDVRCRHVDNEFALVHGDYYLKQYFGKGVLNPCLDFLADHPTETIFVSIDEHGDHVRNTESFSETFDRYVRNAKSQARWYQGDTIPTLGEVRGKLILFRRFSTKGKKGIDATGWKNNATFSIDGPAKLRIQDKYKVAEGLSKYGIVSKFFDETRDGDKERLYVNFCSAAILPPAAYASVVNPLVRTYLLAHAHARLGVVMTDFETDGLNQALVDTNAR